ncbi:MAG TPA: SWIM zinc finger family protein [Blastocatellia bacterium]|nr:SWIM zinc finger family protein [Blastocatellia bacterium]
MGRRSRGRWSEWGYYDYRPTIDAKGGIKAQTKRGEFGASWWAKRWIAVLESFNIGARLGRGRSYARKGQVLSIDIAAGRVGAKVQGSSPKPYEVTIKVRPLPESDWKKLAASLGSQAIFAAKLLAGEMPQEIEEAFSAIGLSLFPEKLRDLETSCSCPDWSNPCKHVAAVYYLLGEEFDRDPFLIFRLRGMSREELLESLGRLGQTKRASTATTTKRTKIERPAPVEKEAAGPRRRGKRVDAARGSATAAPQSEPLATNASSFWGDVTLPEDFFGSVSQPPVVAALPRRLGSFPFWRGVQTFIEAIEQVYSQSSPRGLEVFIGGSKDLK